MTKRVLPADVYDTLEFSALAYGGIGAHDVYVYSGQESVAPCCILGHARWATDTVDTLGGGAVAGAICRSGINPALDSDRAVYTINDRKHCSGYARVSFAEWCAELNVVRGET